VVSSSENATCTAKSINEPVTTLTCACWWACSSRESNRQSELPLCFRLEEALEEIANRCAVISVGDERWQSALKALSANEANQIIVEACLKHDVTPDELFAEISQFTFEY
jgi:hypothetical protein